MTTRREALGVLSGAAGTMLLSSFFSGRAAAGDGDPTAVPWPYVKMDPDEAGRRAHKAFAKGGCMYSVFVAIVGELAAKQGAPYNTFPMAMMKIGAAGMAEWGTLCGALNGCALAVSLLSPEPRPIVDELFGWYQAEPMPDFREVPILTKGEIVKSVAHSPLCHVSVARWCERANVKPYTDEQIDRCDWLAASCARKTVMLLNDQADGVFKAKYPLPKEVVECRSCHGKEAKSPDMVGKMECTTCHFSLGTKHPIMDKVK